MSICGKPVLPFVLIEHERPVFTQEKAVGQEEALSFLYMFYLLYMPFFVIFRRDSCVQFMFICICLTTICSLVSSSIHLNLYQCMHIDLLHASGNTGPGFSSTWRSSMFVHQFAADWAPSHASCLYMHGEGHNWSMRHWELGDGLLHASPQARPPLKKESHQPVPCPLTTEGIH